MPIAAAFEKERTELETILASGIFNRAPNLAELLRYICRKYFDGAAEEIKEYNIAVEAFGRPPEFDQKKDSIVRVEAHRLRKRLKEYYAGEGAGHSVRIEIPSGQYTPRFVFATGIAEAPPTAETEAPFQAEVIQPAPELLSLSPVLAPPSGPHRQKPLAGRWFWWLAAALVLLAAVALFYPRRPLKHPPSAAIDAAAAIASGEEVRILCGVESGSYVDAQERVWQSDTWYEGGTVAQTPHNQIVFGTRDQQIYRNRREGTFRYDIPLKPGVYELRLYFAETIFGENNVAGGGETTRLFAVRINGKPELTYFDVLADAGASTADIKLFRDVSPASDGKLHLEFLPNSNNPFLNAISIVPGIPGRIRPYRIVMRDRGLKDSQGRYWDPDRYARGGQLIARPDSNVQNSDPDLYRSERFGNLTYVIPVARQGKYGVNLYFAESWFGAGNPGGGGAGSRTFDILINGVMLRKDFDIIREAGGVNRAAIVSDHNIAPSHQGKIVISLLPHENYACINALEVVDESP
ncbi:MAG TPA: malectin domain-containing carbohydrate-binding protein [Bryobacteraceae bacterium]|nr:malectin domain-containing carbohydrate-binding protein [Bryobacteraceae bacterium]